MLKKGPVVPHFYPAAVTAACTIETHDFAEAVDAYRALGATVISDELREARRIHARSASEVVGA